MTEDESKPEADDVVVVRSNRGPISMGGTEDMVVLPGPRPMAPRMHQPDEGDERRATEDGSAR